MELLFDHAQGFLLVRWLMGFLIVIKAVISRVQEVVPNAGSVLCEALNVMRTNEPLIFRLFVRHGSLDRLEVEIGG